MYFFVLTFGLSKDLISLTAHIEPVFPILHFWMIHSLLTRSATFIALHPYIWVDSGLELYSVHFFFSSWFITNFLKTSLISSLFYVCVCVCVCAVFAVLPCYFLQTLESACEITQTLLVFIDVLGWHWIYELIQGNFLIIWVF